MSTKIVDQPSLHAKCYMNESEAIVTSLNLYEFSQVNNIEMGFYINNQGIGKQIYEDISTEVKRLCKVRNDPSPIATPDSLKLIVGKKCSPNELDKIFNFEYKGNAGIKEAANGDIILFSNSFSKYPNIEKDGTIYYYGQDTGSGSQQLIYGNKLLYDAYKKQSITIHLFKEFVYKGKTYIKSEPYLIEGKWIFPLAYRD